MRLAELETGETAEIVFRMWGCFHDQQCLAVFSGDDLHHPLIMRPRAPEIRMRTEVPPPDLVDLDGLLESWRKTQGERHSAGTSDCDVRVTWKDDGGRGFTEYFPHAFPPVDLSGPYMKIFLAGMNSGLSRRECEIAAEQQAAFRESALAEHPLRELRFRDGFSLVAVLDPQHSLDADAPGLARTLAVACAERTGAHRVNCRLYGAGQELARTTYVPGETILDRWIAATPANWFGIVILVLLLLLRLVVGTLSWPVRKLRRNRS